MKFIKFLLFAFLLSTPAFAQFANITDTGITDASGATLAAGRECFTPVNNQALPISAQYSGGTITKNPVCSPIIAGVMTPITLVKSSLTNPVNLCYLRTIYDTNKSQFVVGPRDGYACVQPTADTNMNTVSPIAIPGVVAIPGPVGPNGPPGCVVGTTCASLTSGQHVGTPQIADGSGGLKAGISPPSGFPQSLLGFSGPQPAQGITNTSVGAFGLGDPSDILFIRGEYWVCAVDYPSSGFHSQRVDCWHSPNLYGNWIAYSGNPVVTNDQTATWRAACIEGPDLNISTDQQTVFMNILGFSSNCDGEGTGSLGVVSTSVSNFPAGFSALPSAPTIPQPSGTQWLYRGDAIEINGICYMYVNAGDASGNNVLGYFTTTGTCSSTEQTAGAWTYKGTILTDGGQAWEGTNLELQDPQIIADPSGLFWTLFYSVGYYGKIGYAVSSNPASGVWTRLSSNPVPEVGGVLFPRVVLDSNGRYTMITGTNNGTQMSVYAGSGPPSGQQISSNGPITSSNPAYVVGPDGTGKWCINLATLIADGTGGVGAGGPGYFSQGNVYCVTPTMGGYLYGNSSTALFAVQNFGTTGYSAHTFLDSTGVVRGTVGYANSGASTNPGTIFIDGHNTPVVLSYNGLAWLKLDGAGFHMGGPVYPGITPPSSTTPTCLDTTGAFILCSGGTGSSVTLSTNGTNNTSQTTLNFVNAGPFTFSNPSSGNVQIALTSCTGNYFLAAPNGSSGSPTCRAVVANDLPTIPSTQISGLASSATTDTTNATNITSGTLPDARLSTNIVTGGAALNAHYGTPYTDTTVGKLAMLAPCNTAATTYIVASQVTTAGTAVAPICLQYVSTNLTDSSTLVRTTGTTTLSGTYTFTNTITGSISGNAGTATSATSATNSTTTSAISGMTSGQVPLAGSSNTITSSKALAGSGTGIVTGPTSGTVTNDLMCYSGTTGQASDCGILSSNVMTKNGVNTMGSGAYIDYGTNAPTVAMYLYNSGTGTRLGWGIQSGEFQFFNQSSIQYGWYGGGDAQTPNNANQWAKLTSAGFSTKLYHELMTTPASSSASCSAGDFTDDANYHYFCKATNTWVRSPAVYATF